MRRRASILWFCAGALLASACEGARTGDGSATADAAELPDGPSDARDASSLDGDLADASVDGGEAVPDAAVVVDASADGASIPTDGGEPSAGGTDAGGTGDSDAAPRDAGPPDSGPPDAGPTDAGPTDAGPPDAGPPDAGPPDAGPPDAGPRDAGPPDAGPRDAGPRDAGPPDAGPIGRCISGAIGTHAVRFRWRGSGSTAYVVYEENQLPDTSRWRVSAASRSIGYTPVFSDTFLGEGGLDLEGTVFIDVELSTAGLSSIRNVTIAIYGRSFDTTASGSFEWQTFDGVGASMYGLVSNVAPYRWYAADASTEFGPGDRGVLLRISAGPPSDALVVNRVEICFDAD